jgi:hypothetical protein
MRAPFGVTLQPNPGISVSQRNASLREDSIDSTVRFVILSRIIPPLRLEGVIRKKER